MNYGYVHLVLSLSWLLTTAPWTLCSHGKASADQRDLMGGNLSVGGAEDFSDRWRMRPKPTQSRSSLWCRISTTSKLAQARVSPNVARHAFRYLRCQPCVKTRSACRRPR